MDNTSHFSLERPDRGSYFGTWHTPVNGNMLKLDDALFDTYTNNKLKTQNQISEIGANWFDTATGSYYINTNLGFVQILTSQSLLLSTGNQQTLIGGGSTTLHFHNGSSSQYFKVSDPTIASDSDTNKQYYAVPFALFNDTILSLTGDNGSLLDALNTIIEKVDGISSDGLNLTVEGISAADDIITNKGLLAGLGNTDGTIQIGGGASTTESEIVTTNINPINIKSTQPGTLELQVQGSKVWTSGNQGSASGLDSDKVDDCHVDDTLTTSSNLWTASRIESAISGATPTSVDNANNFSNLDIGHFATDTNNPGNRFALIANIYPIGSIYLNASNPANPQQLLGLGTWIPFGQGRMLISSDSTYTAEDTGGEATHTLITAEMPTHSHVENAGAEDQANAHGYTQPLNMSATTVSGSVKTSAQSTESTGQSQAHNNMPPYISVYMWVRTN